MNSTHRLSLLLLVVLAATLPTSAAAAEPVSFDGVHDIDALLRQAEATFDLEREDAVVLFEEQSNSWTADGRRTRSLHTVVYIRTAHAIGSWADLRVPWDSSRQRLRVGALRTWRLSDRRWIESGETAEVETLPYAVNRASDYSNIRETMLLHDGIELPCVVETAYAIEDLEAFRGGMDGRCSFTGEDPRLMSRVVLAVAADATLSHATAGGVPEPVAATIDGLDTLTFAMGPLAPAPHHSDDPGEVAHVSWSTWAGWQSLGEHLMERFTSAQQLDDDLREALADALEDARTTTEKADLVAKLVAESTRLISCDASWFPEPRPAARTWSTAYGHRLDRAVLAATLLGEVGIEANPILISHHFGEISPAVATVAGFDGVSVSVEGLDAILDPAAGELVVGHAPHLGRTVWRFGSDPVPSLRRQQDAAPEVVSLRLDLDHGEEGWSGSAVLTASGSLSPFHHMQGVDPERALKYLDEVVGEMIEGAEVSAYNLEVFEPVRVTVGLAMTAPSEERDSQDRLRLEVGGPAAALGSALAGGPALHEVERDGSLVLPGPISQRLEVHLAADDLVPVDLPAGLEITNQAGRFALTVEDGDGSVVLVRELELSRTRYPAELWPELRELLLAEHDPAHRRLLFKPR